ncbi:putative pentatricopeptide repeat-containing protein [Raphanus sativus]|uniref:Pentatricopeptide repeat-containing protein At1g68930 n=1 Tax=Raphanus sativus TaxID=3726 RepID=A0A6J0M7Q8_RAPSA|nr:putative pentatricopeptide repeat-containing protein At1g68930 [Raphanus sativus]KAJ4909704.1 putative pentatricopeptide repeat-containing protein [Raphanus sativus]
MASSYYSAQIKQCLEHGGRNQSRHLKTIHAHIIKSLPSPETILHNKIIHGYAKIRNSIYARRVFDEIPQPNIYSWNSLLMAHSQSGHLSEMERTFKKLPFRADGVSWNLLISGYSLSGLLGEAVRAYNTMMKEGSANLTRVTLMTMLKLCSDNGCVSLGKQVHGQVRKRGFESYLLVGSALMDMYAKVGFITDAKKVFYGLEDRNTVMYNSLMGGLLASGMVKDAQELFQEMEKDSVSWTAMIKGLAQNGLEKEAIEFFGEMKVEGLRMDQFTFGSVLPACGGLGAIKEGRKIHACIIRTNFQDNVYVGSALIDMYCKCRCIDYAKTVFDGMKQKNVVSWTAMVVGYGQAGRAEEAVKMLLEMERSGVQPDHYTLGQAISACANIASLEEGSQFHGKTIVSGLIDYVTVSNSLVTLYGKCGNIDDSARLFNEMSFRDEVSWTAMVSAYAQFGRANEAIDLFDRMVQEGLKPDGVTLTGVISACSRAGLVEKGQRYFELMTNEYGIVPSNGHYSCTIDLFSRSGRLEEAMSFINGMPFPPDAVGWTTLLSACRNKGNLEIGKWAAESLIELDPHHPAGYTLLSSIYASKERWDCVAQLRREMREKKVRKEPGQSWIKWKGKLHSFSADDESSQYLDQIYAKLEELNQMILDDGYKPDTSFVQHDVEEAVKIKMLNYHSERLAIAFGLIFVPSGLPIRVGKNLRVCVDCHTATKHISSVTGREIIVRDAVRFHRFKDGTCSCGDFW